MISRTFRFDESDLDAIERIAERYDCSQSEAVRLAVRRADSDGIEAGEPKQSESMVEVLTRQIEIKDEQIASLSRALEAAQETAKAAQVLHAQEQTKALESAEQKRFRWPWSR